MSVDYLVVCDRCKKYIWFGKVNSVSAIKKIIHVDERAQSFIFRHLDCKNERGLRIVNLESDSYDETYEDVDP